jgi:hypothetical protein
MINTAERKPIEAGGQLIHQVIYNQAGSIQKALLEYIMNSVDAKATKIEITLDENGIDYSIVDDGDGFGDKNYTLEEKKKCIHEVFGHLGFDHGTQEENYRVYGKFGIGRAQLWAFSKNTWHTHDITMSVDVLYQGLNYEIKQIREHFDGCSIKGQFYNALKPNEIILIKKELLTMAAFAPIDVYFNGSKLNKSMDTLKSTLDLEEVYVELKQTTGLKVYNQGIFIKEYPNYLFGVGGIVCSKVGFPFELNAARNDIQQSNCKLWKKLKNALEKHLGTQTKKTKITDEIRKNLLSKIAGGEYQSIDDNNKRIDYLKKPLIKMIDNKYISISALSQKKFTIAKEKSDSLAEAVHREGAYVVLLEDFTSFLGIDAEDVLQTLTEIKNNRSSVYSIPSYKDVEVLKSRLNSKHVIIPKEKLSKKQKLFLEAMNLYSINSKLAGYEKTRTILLGKSETANGWTDGESYIALNEDLFKDVEMKGISYLWKLVNVVIHEYEHNDENCDLHSLDFYENYHNKTIYRGNIHFDAFIEIQSAYVKRLIRNDIPLAKKLNRSLTNKGMI